MNDHRSPRVHDALCRDPAKDSAYPAETIPIAIPTRASNLNAVGYLATGAGPHPSVLLLHGMPGNEQNIDLAQAMRRAGWNVITFHYRGSWGTPGTFSFAHCLQDAAAALAWLRGAEPGNLVRAHPERLVLMGHSVGGYIAAHLAADGPAVLGAALISPADIAKAFGLKPRPEGIRAIDDNVGSSEGLHILAGTSPAILTDEARTNAEDWTLQRHAASLSARPVLLITSKDGFAEGSSGFEQFLAKTGHLTRAHFPTDHSYSDHRIALQVEVLSWLERLNVAEADTDPKRSELGSEGDEVMNSKPDEGPEKHPDVSAKPQKAERSSPGPAQRPSELDSSKVGDGTLSHAMSEDGATILPPEEPSDQASGSENHGAADEQATKFKRSI